MLSGIPEYLVANCERQREGCSTTYWHSSVLISAGPERDSPTVRAELFRLSELYYGRVTTLDARLIYQTAPGRELPEVAAVAAVKRAYQHLGIPLR